jgi:uncharacterized protein
MSLVQATDLSALLDCDRLVFLNHHGDPSLRAGPSAYQKWLMDQGRQFEQEVVAQFEAIRPHYPHGRLEEGFRLTFDLMRRGVPAVYQGVLLDGDLAGIPDLLVRAEGGSRLGRYHYYPVDVKLATTATDGHRLQVMAYMALLEAVQGVRPQGKLLLRLPPAQRGGEALFREEIVEWDGPAFTARLVEVRALAGGQEPRPFLSALCRECPWCDVCIPMVEQAQDVSLISGLRRDSWQALHERGLGTLRALATSAPEGLIAIRGIGGKTAPYLIRQAQALVSGQPVLTGAPVSLPRSDPEVFFDVESLPSEGLFYLLGTLIVRAGQPVYQADLARGPQEEHQMWESFLRRMDALSGAVIYHYGFYERSTLKTLAGRYGGAEQADRLLERMVDLEKVLKDSVVLPLLSYSLKETASWLGFRWTGETQTGGEAMGEYLSWLEDGQAEHLQHILRYNEDDCRATLAVRDWLASSVVPPAG